MKVGEVWKAKRGTIRCEWDMLEILRNLGDDIWEVDFFPADDAPVEEICEECYEDTGELSRQEIVDQFYRIY